MPDKTNRFTKISYELSNSNENKVKIERFNREAPALHRKAMIAIREFGKCFDTRFYLWDFEVASKMIKQLHDTIDNKTKGIRLN
jgi:hypothetical protein